MSSEQPDVPQWAALVRPGDTLVLDFGDPLTQRDADMIKHRLARYFDPIGVKVVLVSGVKSMVVTRPDEQAAEMGA
jgi:hypothetical protein